MGMRLIEGVLALVLALFAVLQYNDPPPGNVPWVLVYAAGAVVCALAAAGRPMRRASLVLAGAAGAWAAYLLIAVLLAGGSPFTLFVDRMDEGGEEQREAAGLLVMAAATAWVGLRRRRSERGPVLLERDAQSDQ